MKAIKKYQKQNGSHKQAAEVVVITGASAGVGRAVAHEFAKGGAHIGLLARRTEALETARKEVEALGGRAIAIPTDVADSEQVERAASEVESSFGPIDIWVNNAMTTVFAPLREITPEEFKRATEVTYLGTVYGTMAALGRMAPRDQGVIVQVGSALAYRSIPLQAPYCGAKHAIRGFTDSLRSELIHDGSNVHVTMVQLPAMNTPQFNRSRRFISQRWLPKRLCGPRITGGARLMWVRQRTKPSGPTRLHPERWTGISVERDMTLNKRTKRLAAAGRTICLSRFQETSEPMASLTARLAIILCRCGGQLIARGLERRRAC